MTINAIHDEIEKRLAWIHTKREQNYMRAIRYRVSGDSTGEELCYIANRKLSKEQEQLRRALFALEDIT